MPLEPGQTVGHYRIERWIGAGSMGAVFLAEDTRLERKVALKVLPPQMASDEIRLERFQREAKAVAALSHPHIVTIHSVEEAGGTHFLTMELVDGESLDRRLRRGGLPLAQVVDVGVALADALAAAHAKGIIHRDLKPANVMVTRDGRVKVLDFGLAKLARSPSEQSPTLGRVDAVDAPTEEMQHEPSLTDAGTVLGTLPYMSPEQVGGETVDARTDIFSLGVMLYELTTGRRPFAGKNAAETISSILRDTPRPVEEVRHEAPRELGKIIDRCLQKQPQDRIQTARDVFNELRALGKEAGPAASAVATTSTTTAGIAGFRPRLWALAAAAVVILAVAAFWIGTRRGEEPPPPASMSDTALPAALAAETNSIAVLPFVNMSDDAGNEYFSDGISEELLNLLVKVPDLRVISRSSAFSYKGKEINLAQVAEELNVAHILDGSVRKAGNEVRITAQLIEAGSDTPLWSQSYDRTLDDIFAIQDEIAAAVVAELKVTLLGEAPRARETSPEAYALYLQAGHVSRLGTPEGWEQSNALYRQALAIDPDYPAAWVGLAGNYANQTNSGLLPHDEGFRRAREANEKALAVDPDYALAHSSLGWIAMADDDVAGAARHLKRALELDPNHPTIIGHASSLLIKLGRWDEATSLKEYVVSRDPVAAWAHYNLGINYKYADRWGDALASFRTAQQMSPDYMGIHYQIGTALLMTGDPRAALEEFEREGDDEYRVKGRALALHALGRQEEYEAAMAELIEGWGERWPTEVAHVYAWIGQADQAFTWLEKELEKKGMFAPEATYFFAPIQADPRWTALLERAGSSRAELDAIEFEVTPPGS